LLEQQWQQQVQKSLDINDYNEADLITIRVPLMLPYVTDTRDFQRTDGQINVDGKVYRYVKSKVEHGEYVLLCLPDHYQEKLQKGKQDFIELSNNVSTADGAKNNDNSKPAFLKLQTESDQTYFDLHVLNLNIFSTYPLSKSGALASAPHRSPEQPPDTLVS
jgi:hypothetical protein